MTTRSAADVAAGLALILIPFLTTGVKLIVTGWMVLVYLFGLVVFVPLYVLVIVIAATGFFSRRGAFQFAAAGRTRARIAAWLHPVGFLLATGFLVDGGDSGDWGTPFSVLLGLPQDSAFVDASGLFFGLFLVISVGALIWLLVEWIAALTKRKRAAAAAAL